jgi:ornithine cyclodeaminase/alanine dehydrogenase-like protein (mu-crystallin family)
MPDIETLFISKEDIDSLAIGLNEIMDAIEQGLLAHGEKKVIMPPKDHLNIVHPSKHFNILKSYVEPAEMAGVKIIGDFHDNYQQGLPSELSTLLLLSPATGAPVAIINATSTTWMRTGAVTAVGAKYLARPDSRVLGHIGSRGTAWYNVPMLDSLFNFEEIRVTSRRPESRERFAEAMSNQLGKPVIVKETAAETIADADIIVDASRLLEPEVLVPEKAVKPGALIQPYGVTLSVERSLPLAVDKMIVDDWNQAIHSEYGQFKIMIDDGELRSEHIYGEIGEIVAGLKPGRETDHERILFWHKGFSVSDVMIGRLIYDRAVESGVGTKLAFYSNPSDM